MTKKFKVPNFNATIYDLNDCKELIEPFCNSLIDNTEMYFLGPDDEKNKLNIWEKNTSEVKMFEAVIDGIILDFLDTVHPRFMGKGQNYYLDKDSWLNTPNSWQGQRIHRHWEPFLKKEEIGDVTTVLYIKQDETIGIDNGCFEFYEDLKENPLSHVWLPENLNSVYKYVPIPYTMIVMSSDVWHRAKPFTGTRYSFTTDAKVLLEI